MMAKYSTLAASYFPLFVLFLAFRNVKRFNAAWKESGCEWERERGMKKSERVGENSTTFSLFVVEALFALFCNFLSQPLSLSWEKARVRQKHDVSCRERAKVRFDFRKKRFSFCAITKTSVARVAVVWATCVRGWSNKTNLMLFLTSAVIFLRSLGTVESTVGSPSVISELKLFWFYTSPFYLSALKAGDFKVWRIFFCVKSLV